MGLERMCELTEGLNYRDYDQNTSRMFDTIRLLYFKEVCDCGLSFGENVQGHCNSAKFLSVHTVQGNHAGVLQHGQCTRSLSHCVVWTLVWITWVLISLFHFTIQYHGYDIAVCHLSGNGKIILYCEVFAHGHIIWHDVNTAPVLLFVAFNIGHHVEVSNVVHEASTWGGAFFHVYVSMWIAVGLPQTACRPPRRATSAQVPAISGGFSQTV